MSDMTLPAVSSEIRGKILSMEDWIRQIVAGGLDSPECPLTHHFAPGAYGREILLPKDSLVVGKIHKHAHLNMLMKGKVSVATEHGVAHLTAPMVFTSQPGTKRVVYAHEDSIWVTVHVTNQTDLDAIEEEMIAPSYAEYDRHVASLLPQAAIEEEGAPL